MSKQEHVRRAQALIEATTMFELRYAALELRMAIEEITYESIRVYAPRLPAETINKWQPPQLMKAVAQLEPAVNREYRVRFTRQPEQGVQGTEWHDLGEHRAFKPKWLRTTYNRLGNLLHASMRPAGETQAAIEKLRADLLEILKEVARVAASHIRGSMEVVVEFKCAACERPVFCNYDAVVESRRAICLDPACSAEHLAILNGDDLSFYLDATDFECLKCGASTNVENRKLALGHRFGCEKCNVQHELSEIHWGYRLVDAV